VITLLLAALTKTALVKFPCPGVEYVTVPLTPDPGVEALIVDGNAII
jgi:hypothetical protein